MVTIIIVGNVVDGLSHVGPFIDSEDASRYAEIWLKGEDWVCCNLDKPIGNIGE